MKTLSHKLRPVKKSLAPPEVMFKKLVEHMNEGVWVGDHNERTVYANPKFCSMMGYRLQEMIGRESYYFWDEESAKRVREANISKRRKGVSSSYTGNLLTKDGRRIPVLLSGTSLPEGGTVGIMTDLSDLKKKEEAERVLGSAVQYASDAIIIFDRQGNISAWNRGAKITFGYKKEEMLGQKLERIFPSEYMDELMKHSSVQHNVELKGIHRNHNVMHISATLTPVISEKNRSANYCLLIARDITNQNKFEEELTLKLEKMKEAYNKFGVLRRQMDYMFDILEFLNGTQDIKNIADFIVSSVIMLTRVDACVLRLYNAKKDTLDIIGAFGVSSEWQGKTSLKYRGSLAEKAVTEHHRNLKIIDVTQEPRYRSAYLAKKNNLCSLLLIPLMLNGKLVGSLSLYVRPEKKLEIFENEFIEKYAKLIEVALGIRSDLRAQ